jgi:soluble cytochrome b562
MSLTCQVQVILNNLSKEKAETVKKALEPDNVNFPEGLSLYIENIDNKLVFNFESKENMKKLIGTIDEVLEHVPLALKVIE